MKNSDDLCESEEETIPGANAVAKVLVKMREGIAEIVREAQVLVGVHVGDVLDIPEAEGLNGGCFPFSTNVIAIADHIGSDVDHRQAKVTMVYMMVDFDGHHSLNWVGHLMAPNGVWVDHDVLLARIQPTGHSSPNLKISE